MKRNRFVVASIVIIFMLLAFVTGAKAQWTKEQLWEASQLNPKNQPPPDPPPVATLHGKITICRRPGIMSATDGKKIDISPGSLFDQSVPDRPDKYGSDVATEEPAHILASEKCTTVKAHLVNDKSPILPKNTPLAPQFDFEVVGTITEGF